MTVYRMPNSTAPVVDKAGRVTRVWQQYLTGIQDRQGAAVEDLAGGASLAQVIDAINDLLASLRAAGLIREE